jgi:hypothetical protein
MKINDLTLYCTRTLQMQVNGYPEANSAKDGAQARCAMVHFHAFCAVDRSRQAGAAKWPCATGHGNGTVGRILAVGSRRC